jgi:hypothetical protein
VHGFTGEDCTVPPVGYMSPEEKAAAEKKKAAEEEKTKQQAKLKGAALMKFKRIQRMKTCALSCESDCLHKCKRFTEGVMADVEDYNACHKPCTKTCMSSCMDPTSKYSVKDLIGNLQDKFAVTGDNPLKHDATNGKAEPVE